LGDKAGKETAMRLHLESANGFSMVKILFVENEESDNGKSRESAECQSQKSE
jgi:hypothetical protein